MCRVASNLIWVIWALLWPGFKPMTSHLAVVWCSTNFHSSALQNVPSLFSNHKPSNQATNISLIFLKFPNFQVEKLNIIIEIPLTNISWTKINMFFPDHGNPKCNGTCWDTCLSVEVTVDILTLREEVHLAVDSLYRHLLYWSVPGMLLLIDICIQCNVDRL